MKFLSRSRITRVLGNDAFPSVTRSFSTMALVEHEFNLDLALKLAEASQISYKSEDAPILEWSRTIGGYTKCEPFTIGEYRGFFSQDNERALLCFRGSSNLSNWLGNADLFTEKTPMGRMHGGFYNGVYKEMASKLDKLQLELYGKRELILCGHSLGGALAVGAACRFNDSDKTPTPLLYTFGQPRVGLEDLADNFDDRFPGRLFRVVNNNDIVTSVPSLFGYKHSGLSRRMKEGQLISEAFIDQEEDECQCLLDKDTLKLIDSDAPDLTEEEICCLQELLNNPELQDLDDDPLHERGEAGTVQARKGIIRGRLGLRDHRIANYIANLKKLIS